MNPMELIRTGRCPFGKHPIIGAAAGLGAGMAEAEFKRARAGVDNSLAALSLPPLPSGDGTGARTDPGSIFHLLFQAEQWIKGVERDRGAELERLAVRVASEVLGLLPTESAALFRQVDLLPAPAPPFPWPPVEATPPPPRLLEVIDRRVTHNLLIQGMAINGITQALPLARRELDAMDSHLYDRYRLHANLAQLVQFLAPPLGDEPPPALAGFEQVRWEGDRPVIEARAVVLPVLIQELCKGVLEIVMSPGLPRAGELSEAEREDWERRADHPAHESWHFMLGPAFAARLQKAFNAHGLWRLRGESPAPLRDMLYTFSLLAIVPANPLHAALVPLLADPPGPVAADAAARMASLLAEAEREAGEGA